MNILERLVTTQGKKNVDGIDVNVLIVDLQTMLVMNVTLNIPSHVEPVVK